MNRFLAVMPIAVSALIISAIVFSPTPASAHEHREVGDYELTVGFNVEPALVSEPNALFLHVAIHKPTPEGEEPATGEEGEEEGIPVEGLEETLQAEVIVGGGAQTMPLTLEAAFGDPGTYVADVIPTRVGDYSFRIFGEIEGQAVDETFSSGPETFSPIGDTSDLQFPDKVPSNADLSEQIANIDTGGGNSDAALIVAIVGLIAGLAGIGLGGLALVKRGA